MTFTFGLSEGWGFTSDEEVRAQLKAEIDKQDWTRLSGEPIDWTELERRPYVNGYSWTMPYSSGAMKLESAFSYVFQGNIMVRAGTIVLILPFRKRDEWSDNPDFKMTINGEPWHIITSDFILLWWEENYASTNPVEAREAEEIFLADRLADPDTIDTRWFLGALIEMTRQSRRQETPAYIHWP